jgi:regulatory protein
MRSGSLLRRGYGARRIAQDLDAAGIDEHIREDCAPMKARRGARRWPWRARRGWAPIRGAWNRAIAGSGAARKADGSLLRGARHGVARALIALRIPGGRSWVAEAGGGEESARGFWD